MAKILTTPPNAMDTWTGTVTCGNPDCRSVIEVKGADLYWATHHYSDWGGMADKPEPVPGIASTCPACGREWFLSMSDQQSVPPSVSRQLSKRRPSGR